MAFAPTNKQRQGRPKLLAAVMLAVLAGSVALASLLVHNAQVPIRQAERIIAGLRQTGLSRYWGHAPVTLQYRARDRKGRQVGGLEITRNPVEGGYAGSALLVLGDGQAQEAWTLWEDATQGTYTSASTVGEFTQTTISLSGRELTVLSAPALAQAQVPANYIPEGLMELVIYLVAREAERATFVTIFNSSAIVGGRVQFMELQMRPAGQNKVSVRIPALSGGDRRVYHLSPDGKIMRIEHLSDGLVYELMQRDSSTPPAVEDD